MSVLVTGGTGFIGSHTCFTLLKEGYEVIVLDSNANSSYRSLQRVLDIGHNEGCNFSNKLFFIKGDLRDREVVEKLFQHATKNNIGIESVIHFAGLKAVAESVSDPLSYWDNNLLASINLFKTMLKHNCKKIVFSSSATVYGTKNEGLLDEKMLKNPINPYGDTKSAIEILLENISKGYERDWRIANLRYFNPIGAHESGLIGEDPLDIPNNIFPIICKVAKSKKETFKIFGDNWPTKDGTCIRDYIHVMDLAEAHKAALDFLLVNKPQCINLNIGTGKGTSVLELIKTFQKVNNCFFNYIFTEKRDGDAASVVANNELALKKLKWVPKRNLIDMCIDGWRWSYMNKHGYSEDLPKNNISQKLKIIDL